MTEAESIHTRTLARIVGPYMIVMALALAARMSTMQLVLPAFMQDGPLVLATGAFTLMAGLTMLAFHHHVSSPPAIVITVIGAAAALKGAFLMTVPQLGAPLTALVVRVLPALLIVALIMFLIGIWLTAIGWFAKRPAQA